MYEMIDPLISAKEIDLRIEELAQQIMDDYKDTTITLVCILKGSVVFTVDLAKKLKQDIELEFIEVSSYRDETSGGTIKITKDLQNSIANKHVLIIEDIIDSGRTIAYLVNHLYNQHPASLKICSLLDKPYRRIIDGLSAEYVGFTIPDEYVVGFGLDYAQKYRNLPYIGLLSLTD